ncbi:hypothetical protein B0J13DRAFT_114428 [Dactylonectria estremocensis]|uniref:Uncharacterized protein n=1 Tax=Dactylonectria estremocensis TaxID=1079267 RepID=A0A9P9FCI0_9HYPO|nr:hypothetical protein B0J13DRAFT_114428 [Dactylonectria estremocensis]
MAQLLRCDVQVTREIEVFMSSVPSQRVLSCDGRRDVRRAGRIAHATPTAAMAVTAILSAQIIARGSTIRGEVLAQESTTHKGGATIACVTHLRGGLAAADGAGAAVAQLLLALITTGHKEHGSAVHGSQTDRTHSNTSNSGLLLGSLVIRTTVAESISLARVRVVRAAAASSCSLGIVAQEINLGVDDGGQVPHDLLIVVVESRVGGCEIDLQVVDHVLGIIH